MVKYFLVVRGLMYCTGGTGSSLKHSIDGTESRQRNQELLED